MLLRQGDEVKAGQVLGFIEQLGTFMPVEVRFCTQALSCYSNVKTSATPCAESISSRRKTLLDNANRSGDRYAHKT